jgi:hypothetical protein
MYFDGIVENLKKIFFEILKVPDQESMEQK